MAPRAKHGGSVTMAVIVSMVLATGFLFHVSLADMPGGGPIRIDCGSDLDIPADENGMAWDADNSIDPQYNGTTEVVSDPTNILSKVDKTLRKFDTGDPCYHVYVDPGKYLIRMSWAFNPTDDVFLDPETQIYVEETLLQQLSLNISSTGISYYQTDFITTIEDGVADICLMPLFDVPFINSLEVLPQDSWAYAVDGVDIGDSLSTFFRFNLGGPRIEEIDDPGFRIWDKDLPSAEASGLYKVITSDMDIAIPEEWDTWNLPQSIFQTAREGDPAVGDGELSLTFTFDSNFKPLEWRNSFLVVLYFAELEPGRLEGERSMDIHVNGQEVATEYDILREAHATFTAQILTQVVTLDAGADPSTASIQISLKKSANGEPSVAPMVNAVEIFEIIKLENAPPSNDPTVVRVDCGGFETFVDQWNRTWAADRNFSSGLIATVPYRGKETNRFNSLRFFPFGERNCYTLSVPNEAGLYMLRPGFNYLNYDGRNSTSPFHIGVEATLVYQDIQAPVAGPVQRGSLDIITFVSDGVAEFCLHDADPTGESFDRSDPFISSLELFPLDPQAYSVDPNTILATVARISCGLSTASFGDLLQNPTPEGGYRAWYQDSNVSPGSLVITVPEEAGVDGTDEAPNVWPEQLYRQCRVADPAKSFNFSLALTQNSTYKIYLHFAEIAKSEVPEGARIFDAYILVSGMRIKIAQNIDIIKEAGAGNTSYVFNGTFSVPFAAPGMDVLPASLLLQGQIGAGINYGPLLCGFEIYRVVQRGPQARPQDARGMWALRDSLIVTDDFTWQGDPCFPKKWEGVECEWALDDSDAPAWVVRSVTLPPFDLNGTLTEDIQVMTALKSLKLSTLGIRGQLPWGFIWMNELHEIDLSNNNLKGPIPWTLGKCSGLENGGILRLNNNNLSGPIPPDVLRLVSDFNVTLDVSGNPFLCGGMGYAECPKSLLTDEYGFHEDKGGGLQPGQIAGLVIGGLAGLAILTAIIVCFCLPAAKKAHRRHTSKTFAYGAFGSGEGFIEEPKMARDYKHRRGNSRDYNLNALRQPVDATKLFGVDEDRPQGMSSRVNPYAQLKKDGGFKDVELQDVVYVGFEGSGTGSH